MKTPSRDVVLNILSRTCDDDAPTFTPPGYLPVLMSEPTSDCGRYDVLLAGGNANA